MYFLTTDKQEGQDCGMCEILLKGFRSECEGRLPLADWVLRDAETKWKIAFVMQSCPEHAIHIEEADAQSSG